MLFWIVAVLLAAVVAGIAVAPLLRGEPPAEAEATDVALYREQLAEVDRDLERGTIGPQEAERARTEIARRLLAADRADTRSTAEAPRRTSVIAATLSAIALAGGAVGLYALLGAPGAPDRPLAARLERSEEMRAGRVGQEEAEAMVAETAPATPPADMAEDYLRMVEQLRELVSTRTEDLQGWRLLAQHEAALGNYAAAARAQSRVLELLGGDARAADRVAYANLLVAAAGGYYVSPEAEGVVRGVLDADPDNPGARYTLGLLYAQSDRPDLAFQLWRPVAENGEPGTMPTELARAQIEAVAQAAGISYSLPEQAPPEGLTPEAMVARLSDRLATQGGPPPDWARLITSLVVLGQTEEAEAVLAEARSAFAGSDEAQAVLDAAAAQAGLGQ